MRVKSSSRTRSFSAAVVISLASMAGTGLSPATAVAELPNLGKYVNQIYSTPWLNRFCSDAQRYVATTGLKSTIVTYESLEGFVGSDAMPWRGAEDLPLTSSQYVAYAVRADGTHYVQGFMCKMKSADGLNDAYPGLGAYRTSCAAVAEANYMAVLYSLMSDRDAPPIAVNDVEFDWWRTFSGEQWTDDAPAPFAYTSAADGKLHLVGKELYVPVDIVIDFIGPEKKGVHYCQVASPVYIRDLLTGTIDAPVCGAPPRYKPDPFAPLPTWNCQNP